MLCSRVNARSRINESVSDVSKKPIGCLATIRATKRLKGLKEKKTQKKAAAVTTPGGAGHVKTTSAASRVPTGGMMTPMTMASEDKENVASTGMTCRTASRLNGLGVRGQLKVSLEVENGLLAVNVAEGKQLKFKQGSSRNSYVQVSVLPGNDPMMRYTTKMAYSTSNPRYDETFRHELVAGDERKRVLIAVWSECGVHSVLVGCMSFGVKHLLYKWKSIAGWFYLLNQELGSKKHLKMFSSRQALADNTNKQSGSSHQKQTPTHGANAMTLLVTPNPSQYGYGFLVSGASPPQVAQVLPGSAAEVAGLQVGDVIIKIDTQNVARSTSGSINKIIEEANETLVMEVRRMGEPASLPRSSSLPRSASSSRSRLAPCSSMSTLNSWVPFDDNNNNEGVYGFRPYRTALNTSMNSHGSSSKSCSSHHSYQSIRSLARSRDGSLKRVASQESLKMSKRLEPISEEFSLSPRKPVVCEQKHNLSNESEFTYQWKQSRKSCDGESDHGLQYLEQDCWNIVAKLDRAVIPKQNASMIPNASVSTNANETELPTFEATVSTFRDESGAQWEQFQKTMTSSGADSLSDTTFVLCTTTETRHMVSMESGYSCTTRHDTTHALQTSSIFLDPVLVEIADRLLKCEEEFAQKMHFGSERFSRPLRHSVLSPGEHKTLFQNIEKLVVISEFHVKKLNELKYEGGAGVSSAYLSQLALMCDAYTVYCQGLAQGLSLLDDLSHKEEFMRFVQEPRVPDSELNITEFLEKPLLHLEELVYHLSHLVEGMPQGDADYANMRHVLSALKGCYTNLQAEFTLLRDSFDEEDDDEDEDDVIDDADQFQSSVDSSTQSVSAVFSIDNEVAELQKRLVFPAHMQPFQIVGPNRHLIYQAELLFVDTWKWIRVVATLLSDQLVLTMEETPENPDYLIPLMPPILLKDICSWDFDNYHPSEFMLMLDNHDSLLQKGEDADEADARLQSLVFRALEEDQKSTWRHLLAQRVRTCRSQREYCL